VGVPEAERSTHGDRPCAAGTGPRIVLRGPHGTGVMLYPKGQHGQRASELAYIAPRIDVVFHRATLGRR
jgi:hypothetical protein